MVSLKGISPLVATVLLIAITMTVAGGLAFFASSIVNNKLSEASNQTIATSCQFAKLQVLACNYNTTLSQFTVTLWNPGTVDVQNITSTFFYSNGVINSYNLNDSLASGSYRYFILSNIVSGYNSIYFGSLACPDLRVQGC